MQPFCAKMAGRGGRTTLQSVCCGQARGPKEPREPVMEEPLPDSLELQRKRMRRQPAQGSGDNMIMTAGFAGLAEETGDDVML